MGNFIEQTIHGHEKTMSGMFIITKIYTPEHQRSMSTHEASAGNEYFV